LQAAVGDRKAVLEAEFVAKRRAIDIQQGQVIAGSVAQLIERFRDEVAPTHYRDQSKDGLAVRASPFRNLIKFFGTMAPSSLQTVHGYQYLEARAKSGAPAKANKELSMMSTICHYGVRLGLIKANPLTGMMLNRTKKQVRTVSRSQIVRFYLWSLRQGLASRCSAVQRCSPT
jgi:site-specific recombinase XerC